MPLECYITVSDLSLCQKCPALFAYKFHLNKKSAWHVGIKSNGDPYGSIFHKDIAEKFFEIASNPRNILHEKILHASMQGEKFLEEFIREKIFLPFIERKSKYLTSNQILSIAHAIEIWVKGMSNFFSKNSPPVFMEPERNLQGCFYFKNEDAILIIKGRYDALIFNPDKAEARLFEFKGFKKSDITVALSQSLIYSFLIEKSTGIIPSIEIIYLDDEKPEIFNSKIVRNMIYSGLPGLFYSALNIILLRRLPEMLNDKKLCESCKFKFTCKDDMNKIFKLKKRRGASMMSLLAFLFASVVITAQVFFFSKISADSVREDRELLGVRMQLEKLVEEIKANLSSIEFLDNITDVTYTDKPDGFYEKTKQEKFPDKLKEEIENLNKIDIYTDIHKLDYDYKSETFKESDFVGTTGKNTFKKIFPPMGSGYYLIRARKKFQNTGKVLMLQVLVYKNDDDKVTTKSSEEIWY